MNKITVNGKEIKFNVMCACIGGKHKVEKFIKLTLYTEPAKLTPYELEKLEDEIEWKINNN